MVETGQFFGSEGWLFIYSGRGGQVDGIEGMVEAVLVDSVGPAFEFIEEGLISFFIAVLHNIYVYTSYYPKHTTASYYLILPPIYTFFIIPTQKDTKIMQSP